MKKLSRLKLNNAQQILSDSEMKMIQGGGYEEYSYISPESSCNAVGGTCDGYCKTIEIYDGKSIRFYERNCVQGSTNNDGYILNCLCAHISSNI